VWESGVGRALMTKRSDSTGPPLIRFGCFAFTARAIRNAIRRDRQALAVARVSHALPCGVRQLAQVDRWVGRATAGGDAVAQVPTGPAGELLGLGPAIGHWFQRLVREGRYRQAHCPSCRCDYPKGQLRSLTWRWPGIRVRGHGPTGARVETWRCCPRGHRIVRLGFRVS
jgi:hypothetical protein